MKQLQSLKSPQETQIKFLSSNFGLHHCIIPSLCQNSANIKQSWVLSLSFPSLFLHLSQVHTHILRHKVEAWNDSTLWGCLPLMFSAWDWVLPLLMIPLLSFLLNCVPVEEAMMGHVIGFLPPMQKIWIKFLASSLGLAHLSHYARIWGASQQMTYICLPLSLKQNKLLNQKVKSTHVFLRHIKRRKFIIPTTIISLSFCHQLSFDFYLCSPHIFF